MKRTGWDPSRIMKLLRGSRPLPSLRSTIWPMRVTREQQRSLLRIVSFAVEHGWQLPPLLDARTQDEHGTQRRKVRRLAQLLRQGTSLPDALERLPSTVSPQASLAVRLGLATGRLPEMLRAVAATESWMTPSRQRLRLTWWYLGGVSLVILLIWSFSVVKLQPVFRQVASDFQTPVPAGHQWLSAVAASTADYWPWFGLMLAVLIWWIASGRLDRSLHYGFLAPLSGRTLLVRSAELLAQLSVVKEHGRPMASALSTLARYHYDPAFRPRLLFVRNELEQQADLWDSMRRAGLISAAEVRFLASAEPLDNTAWVLRHLAERKWFAIQRRTGIGVECFRVGVILLLGAAVGLFVAGNFELLPYFILSN